MCIRDSANSYSYKNIFNFGNVEQEKYDENYIYSLPFQKGKTQLIYQGYNGKFSHQNANALDFNLKIGDKIFAAREGKVVEVVQNNNQSCANLYCAKFNNKIVIMHSHGTFGDYAHLKFNGAEVKVGEEIKLSLIHISKFFPLVVLPKVRFVQQLWKDAKSFDALQSEKLGLRKQNLQKYFL